MRDVPDELRQNVQDGDEEVGDGEVVHEVVHPRRRLPAQLPPQRHQHDPVAEQGHKQDDGLQGGQRMYEGSVKLRGQDRLLC